MEALKGAGRMTALEGVHDRAGAAVAPGGMAVAGLRVAFGANEVLKGVTLGWEGGTVSSLIGPSGCGKTTLLRSLNRLLELADGVRIEGSITLAGSDVRDQPPHEIRRRVGMVFQRPNPFPMSILDNLAYAMRDQASRRPRARGLHDRVEQVLRRAFLWDEVKDSLNRSALRLSGGQQQRLCIARVLAQQPDVILMDEPCASLDPHSTARIEELIASLQGQVTQIVVTHNLAQARRISDRVAFLLMGELVEHGAVERVFDRPERDETRDFVAGTFG
ncbi:MAG: phosphate ABC transporter ATP-binding protein [Thermoleophilia bacterium]